MAVVTAHARATPSDTRGAPARAARWAKACAAAIVCAAVAACNGEPAAPSRTSAPSASSAPSAPSSSAPSPSAADANGPGATSAAAPPASAPHAAGFDVGEIKTADEYLAEPEFAAADLRRGELLAFACIACHTLGEGEPHNIGPNLHGVFGRPAATLPDFAYSPALRESGLVWTPRSLAAWLENPARFVEGTTMAFAGYREPEERRDVIAYLLNKTR